MANDVTIGLNLRNLPSQGGVNRLAPGPSQTEEKPLKSLGDPLPRRADLNEYPEKFQRLFHYDGLLDMLKRKLNALTGEKYVLVPAEGNRVSIDDKGQVYVGMEFLDETYGNEAVVAGVLAHEWGHFPTRRKTPKHIEHLPWEEIFRMRRMEETQADMFCGRALFLLRYPFEPVVNYLRSHEDPKHKSEKYHTVESRARVIAATYHSQAARNGMADRLKISDAVYGDPIHGSRLIGS